MSDHQNSHSRRRAQRVQLACLPCRNGKLKCNREYPSCDQCNKRNRETECIYTEKGLRYNTARRDFESMRDKLERLEDFVSNLRDSGSLDPPRHEEITNDSSASATEGNISGPTGDLRYEDNTTRFIGPTHWESIIEDLADVKSYFKEGSSLPSASPESNSGNGTFIPSIDIAFGLSGSYTRQELLRFLPLKADLDRYVATWFNTTDSARTILHAPSFQLKYSEFWTDQASVTDTWLACLFAVASLGAEIVGQTRNDAEVLTQAENLRRLTAHALVLADYTKIHPRTVQTIYILIKSRLFRSHDIDNETWVLMGIACRLALRAGYHRDPGSNAGLQPLVCEMKRRVWHHLRELEIHVAYKAGLSSTMQGYETDTQLPLNLFDTDFSLESVPPARPRTESTPIMYSTVHVQLSYIFGSIVTSLHSLKPHNVAQTQELFECLEEWRRNLPQPLQPVPLEHSLFDAPELVFTRIKLEILRLRCIIILYRRYLGKDGFDVEIKRCIDAAASSVRVQSSLVQASRPGGQLEICLVHVRQYLHDFILAAMLLCWHARQIAEKSNADLPSQSDLDTLHLLAQACNLWHEDGHGSERSIRALGGIDKAVRQMLQTATPNNYTSSGVDLSTQTGADQGPLVRSLESPNQGFEDLLIDQDGMFSNFLEASAPFGGTFVDFGAFQ